MTSPSVSEYLPISSENELFEEVATCHESYHDTSLLGTGTEPWRAHNRRLLGRITLAIKAHRSHSKPKGNKPRPNRREAVLSLRRLYLLRSICLVALDRFPEALMNVEAALRLFDRLPPRRKVPPRSRLAHRLAETGLLSPSGHNLEVCCWVLQVRILHELLQSRQTVLRSSYRRHQRLSPHLPIAVLWRDVPSGRDLSDLLSQLLSPDPTTRRSLHSSSKGQVYSFASVDSPLPPRTELNTSFTSLGFRVKNGTTSPRRRQNRTTLRSLPTGTNSGTSRSIRRQIRTGTRGLFYRRDEQPVPEESDEEEDDDDEDVDDQDHESMFVRDSEREERELREEELELHERDISSLLTQLELGGGGTDSSTLSTLFQGDVIDDEIGNDSERIRRMTSDSIGADLDLAEDDDDDDDDFVEAEDRRFRQEFLRMKNSRDQIENETSTSPSPSPPNRSLFAQSDLADLFATTSSTSPLRDNPTLSSTALLASQPQLDDDDSETVSPSLDLIAFSSDLIHATTDALSKTSGPPRTLARLFVARAEAYAAMTQVMGLIHTESSSSGEGETQGLTESDLGVLRDWESKFGDLAMSDFKRAILILGSDRFVSPMILSSRGNHVKERAKEKDFETGALGPGFGRAMVWSRWASVCVGVLRHGVLISEETSSVVWSPHSGSSSSSGRRELTSRRFERDASGELENLVLRLSDLIKWLGLLGEDVEIELDHEQGVGEDESGKRGEEDYDDDEEEDTETETCLISVDGTSGLHLTLASSSAVRLPHLHTDTNTAHTSSIGGNLSSIPLPTLWGPSLSLRLADILRLRAECLLLLGRFAEARSDLDRAFSISPDSTATRLRLGSVLLHLSSVAMISNGEDSQNQNQESIEELLVDALSCFEVSDSDESDSDVTKAVDFGEELDEDYYASKDVLLAGRAVALLRLGRLEEAFESANRVLENCQVKQLPSVVSSHVVRASYFMLKAGGTGTGNETSSREDTIRNINLAKAEIEIAFSLAPSDEGVLRLRRRIMSSRTRRHRRLDTTLDSLNSSYCSTPGLRRTAPSAFISSEELSRRILEETMGSNANVDRCDIILGGVLDAFEAESELLQNPSRLYEERGVLDFGVRIHSVHFYDPPPSFRGSFRNSKPQSFDETMSTISSASFVSEQLSPHHRQKRHHERHVRLTGNLEHLVVDVRRDKALVGLLRQVSREGHSVRLLDLQRRWSRSRDVTTRALLVSEMSREIQQVIEHVSTFFGGPCSGTTSVPVVYQRKVASAEGNEVLLGTLAGGGLCRQRAVCFKVVCDAMRVPCRLMRGWWPAASRDSAHAWVMLRLGDTLFAADLMDRLDLVSDVSYDSYMALLGESRAPSKAEQEFDMSVLKGTFDRMIRKRMRKQSRRYMLTQTGWSKVSQLQVAHRKYRHDVVVGVKQVDLVDADEVLSGCSMVSLLQRQERYLHVGATRTHPTIATIFGRFQHTLRNVATVTRDRTDHQLECIVMDRFNSNAKVMRRVLKNFRETPRVLLTHMLSILVPVARAIRSFHTELGVAHLAIKPTNVLLVIEPGTFDVKHVKLTDPLALVPMQSLGCMRARTGVLEDQIVGESGEMMSSALLSRFVRDVRFSAPEISDARGVGFPADIFSFGRLIHYFLICFGANALFMNETGTLLRSAEQGVDVVSSLGVIAEDEESVAIRRLHGLEKKCCSGASRFRPTAEEVLAELREVMCILLG